MLSDKQIRQVQRIIKGMQELTIVKESASRKGQKASFAPKRIRRTGKELAAFKKSLAAERKQGASVADLARKYGVTPSYIYQLPEAPKKAAAAKVTKKSAKKASKTRRSGAKKDKVEPVDADTEAAKPVERTDGAE